MPAARTHRQARPALGCRVVWHAGHLHDGLCGPGLGPAAGPGMRGGAGHRHGLLHRALALLAALLLALPACALDLELNEASQAELESLPGVGPALSAKLIGARREGLFADWADAMRRVKGLGPAAAQRLSAAGLTVAGAAYTGPAVAPPRARPSRAAAASAALPPASSP